jgi:tight adherence protein B
LASGLVAAAGALAGLVVASVRRAALEDALGVRVPPASGRSFAIDSPAAVVAGVVLAIVLLTSIAGPVAGAAACVLAVGGRWAFRRRRDRRAGRSRADGLPDAAAALAAALRAGLSLPQAIAYARDEATGPVREDLGRLATSIELGAPVGDALSGWADETGSDDARLVAAVVDLHRRTGGDLPSVLDGVVATLRDRRAAVREVRALTAQARLSGVILGALPIGFFAFLLVTARTEMLAAIATPLGRTAVVVGLTLEVLAFAWIRRLLEVR